METKDHKIAMLERYGFTVGDRDPRLNTGFEGKFMVAEITHETVDQFDLPTEDASNGPRCVVGNDLEELIDESFEHLMGLADDHNGIDATWEEISALSAEDLPARKYTSLEPQAAPAP